MGCVRVYPNTGLFFIATKNKLLAKYVIRKKGPIKVFVPAFVVLDDVSQLFPIYSSTRTNNAPL